MDDLKVVAEFDYVEPEELYGAWLDGEQHAAMTGGEATGEARVGADFTAWDGYISGTNLELEEHRRIVQSWRTTEFADDDPDSRIEITFEPTEDGTRLTLLHTQIPTGQGPRYFDGWAEHYIEPMLSYFDIEDDEIDG